MNENQQQNQSRRELLVRAMRYASAGFLAALGGSVFAKRYKLMKQGECINRGPCTNCEFLRQCELPQALAAK